MQPDETPSQPSAYAGRGFSAGCCEARRLYQGRGRCPPLDGKLARHCGLEEASYQVAADNTQTDAEKSVIERLDHDPGSLEQPWDGIRCTVAAMQPT